MNDLFEFIKKLFGMGNEDRVSSSLIEKARNSALFSENHFSAPNITSESLTRHYYDSEELEQLQLQQMLHDQHQNELLQQQQQQQLQDLQHMQEMDNLQQMQDLQNLQDLHNDNDPFQNPGLDMTVDEYHHNIDHGFDDHHHHDF